MFKYNYLYIIPKNPHYLQQNNDKHLNGTTNNRKLFEYKWEQVYHLTDFKMIYFSWNEQFVFLNAELWLKCALFFMLK
jgi:hypothetical protein